MAALIGSVLLILLGEGLRDFAAVPWVLLAAAGLTDLALSMSGAKTLDHDIPDEVFVGESVPLALTVAPAPPELEARLDWPTGLSGPERMIFDGGPEGTARAEVTALRRGVWSLPHLWLRWPSRLGLFDYAPKLALGAELRVVPNIRMVQSGQITTQVKSALYGIKENLAVGEGSEFHQLRDFVPGMDVKTIDWKRSARTRSLVARELRAERNHHVILALDNGYLMREEIAGLPKIDHAVTAALAVGWAAALGGDQVGYYSYDARPNVFVAPESGRRAFARMRSWSAGLDYVERETNHTLALSALNARTPKRSLIIVFTDFIDTTSAELLIENIALLAKRHLLIFVALRDPDTEALMTRAPDDLDGVATLVAAGQTISERRLVLERLSRLGVTIVDARPDQVTAQLVTTYLDIKARELI